MCWQKTRDGRRFNNTRLHLALPAQEAMALVTCIVDMSTALGRCNELLAMLDIPAWVYTLVNHYIAKEEAAYSSRLAALKLLSSLATCAAERDQSSGEESPSLQMTEPLPLVKRAPLLR